MVPGTADVYGQSSHQVTAVIYNVPPKRRQLRRESEVYRTVFRRRLQRLKGGGKVREEWYLSHRSLGYLKLRAANHNEKRG
jgi:hypothetical protein